MGDGLKKSAIVVESQVTNDISVVLSVDNDEISCLKGVAKNIIAFYKKHDKEDGFKYKYALSTITDEFTSCPSLSILRSDKEVEDEEIDTLTFCKIWSVKCHNGETKKKCGKNV